MSSKSPSPPRAARHLSPEGRGRLQPRSAQQTPPGAIQRARALRRRQTDAEGLLWWELKNRNLNGYKFVRQVPLGSYVADFVCREHRLVIEVDGGQHSDSNHDGLRTEWLNQHGYSVIRFWNHQILNERSSVLTMILDVLAGHLTEVSKEARFWPATPSPLRGEVLKRSEGGEG